MAQTTAKAKSKVVKSYKVGLKLKITKVPAQLHFLKGATAIVTKQTSKEITFACPGMLVVSRDEINVKKIFAFELAEEKEQARDGVTLIPVTDIVRPTVHEIRAMNIYQQSRYATSLSVDELHSSLAEHPQFYKFMIRNYPVSLTDENIRRDVINAADRFHGSSVIRQMVIDQINTILKTLNIQPAPVHVVVIKKGKKTKAKSYKS